MEHDGKPVERPPDGFAKAPKRAGNLPFVVVEDDLRRPRILEAELGRQGYAVLAATSGMGAVDIFKVQPICRVVPDTIIPEGNRTAACRHIKSDPSFPRTPLVPHTSTDSDRNRISGLEMKADNTVRKPFGGEELVPAVRAHPGAAAEADASPLAHTSFDDAFSRH